MRRNRANLGGRDPGRAGTRVALVATIAMVVAGQLPALAVPAGAAPPAGVQEALSERLRAGHPDDPALVFVHGTDLASARRAARDTGFRVIDSFESIDVAVAAGRLGDIERLRREPGISYLERADIPVEYLTDTSHIATRSRDVTDGFQVPRGRGRKPTKKSRLVGPYDGTGVSIAVVDSGIDATHRAFQTRDGTKVVRNLLLACTSQQDLGAYGGPGGIVAPATCAADHTERENPWIELESTDTNGHGTGVADVAAGVEVDFEDRRLHGAAPGAKLVGLSVGWGLIYGDAAAFEWILENHDAPCGEEASAKACPPIRVVNNSWGTAGDYGTYDPSGAINRLQDEMIAAGITVVWAAGNDAGDGSDNRTNSYATSPTPGSIAVAGYDDLDTGTRNNALASSSSRGKKGSPETYPDLTAPGSSITAACSTISTCPSLLEYENASGTSFAAPHVTGIVAQLLDADPTLTPAEVENILEDSAHKFSFGGAYEFDPANADDTTSFDKGHGLVDAAAAVATVLGLPEPSPPPVAPMSTADPDGTISRRAPTSSYSGTNHRPFLVLVRLHEMAE